MPKIGDTKVPAELNLSSKPRIMIIGEAPGKDEEEGGAPFIGRSGQLLTRYLGRHRVRRSQVAFSNLCKYRPSGNKFEHVLNSTELMTGLIELREEILSVDPNIIIACGNWPMFFLTGKTNEKGKAGTGISLWRGSIVPCTLVEGYKVLITYHPAYIVRPEGFHLNPVFHYDVGKAIKDSENKDLNYPEYTEIVAEGSGVLVRNAGQEEFFTLENGEGKAFVENLAHEICTSPQVSTDIETYGNSLACVGFATNPKWGLCITHEYKGGWDLPQEILANDVNKVLHFGAFDINYLDHFYGWSVNGYGYHFAYRGLEGENLYTPERIGKIVGWDTYVATATLLPEFPRGLDFLTSIYTPFPYYKQEGKTWKETSNTLQFWQYNIKDVIATLMIAEEQQREIAELFPLGLAPSPRGYTPQMREKERRSIEQQQTEFAERLQQIREGYQGEGTSELERIHWEGHNRMGGGY